MPQCAGDKMPQECIGQEQNAQAGQNRSDGPAGRFQNHQNRNDTKDNIRLGGHTGIGGNALPVQQNVSAAQQGQDGPTLVNDIYLCQALFGSRIDKEQADRNDQPMGGS